MTRSSSVLLNVLGAFEATYNKAKRRFNNMVRIHCGGAARRLMTVPSHPCCHAMRIHPHLRAGHQLCHGAAPILAARPVWYVYVTASFTPCNGARALAIVQMVVLLRVASLFMAMPHS